MFFLPFYRARSFHRVLLDWLELLDLFDWFYIENFVLPLSKLITWTRWWDFFTSPFCLLIKSVETNMHYLSGSVSNNQTWYLDCNFLQIVLIHIVSLVLESCNYIAVLNFIWTLCVDLRKQTFGKWNLKWFSLYSDQIKVKLVKKHTFL